MDSSMSVKTHYTVLVYLGDRDLTKHTTSKREAKRILKEMEEAAKVLGLLDIFKGEIHEITT